MVRAETILCNKCPCHAKVHKSEGFHKVIELKKSGMDVVRHTILTYDVNNTKTSKDVVIVRNRHNMQIPSEVCQQFGTLFPNNNIITCPRCKQILKHTQEVLNKVPSNQRQDIILVCGHCRLKVHAQGPCNECDNVKKMFLSLYGVRNISVGTENRLNKKRSYSDMDLNLLTSDLPKYPSDDKIQPVFRSEDNLLHLELFGKQSQKKQSTRTHKKEHQTIEIFRATETESNTTLAETRTDSDHIDKHDGINENMGSDDSLFDEKYNIRKRMLEFGYSKKEMETVTKPKEEQLAEYKKLLQSKKMPFSEHEIHKDISYFFPTRSEPVMHKPKWGERTLLTTKKQTIVKSNTMEKPNVEKIKTVNPQQGKKVNQLGNTKEKANVEKIKGKTKNAQQGEKVTQLENEKKDTTPPIKQKLQVASKNLLSKSTKKTETQITKIKYQTKDKKLDRMSEKMKNIAEAALDPMADLLSSLIKSNLTELPKREERKDKVAVVQQQTQEEKPVVEPVVSSTQISELPSAEMDEPQHVTQDNTKESLNVIVIGDNLTKYRPPLVPLDPLHSTDPETKPLLFEKQYNPMDATSVTAIGNIPKQEDKKDQTFKGIIHYALSNRTFIENGWTMLPTEKVVRKINVYRMRPAQPQFDWFERNKKKRMLKYASGEKLADFDDNGRGRWYYKNGRLALDYYDAEETNVQQRFVVYSSGEPDERGRTHPITILATFDHLGNGVVFDHSGKIRLKYNQTEGVVLDRNIGPVSHWQWHTLNDPPVLQKVMIDTQMSHKDPTILQLGDRKDLDNGKKNSDNEDMLAIEFENFIKQKCKKLSSDAFKPFQIKMKALKINKHFSLKVLDQATIYLIFRDGTTNLKVNLGMILDNQEIVDTDTAEVGEVANSLKRFPAQTKSLEALQRSIAFTQSYERARTERERKTRPIMPCASIDNLTAAKSQPFRAAFKTVQTSPGETVPTSKGDCRCTRKPSNNVYYNSRLM